MEALRENVDVEISVVSSVKMCRIYFYLSKVVEYIIKKNVYLYELDPLLNLSMLRTINSINKRKDVDILHLFYVNHPLFFLYGKLHKKPVVIHHFGNPHFNYLESIRTPKGIDAYITTSSETGYFSKLGIKNVHQIKPAINTNVFKRVCKEEARQFFGLSEEDFVILYMGGLNEMKIPLDFLITMKDLLKDRTKLIIMGRGETPHAQEIRQLIKEISIKSNVILKTEPLSEREKVLVYNAADVLILPFNKKVGLRKHVTVIDPPITILEAMARGTPVIAPGTLSIPDIIKNDYNGFITSPGDFEILKRKLAKLIMSKGVSVKIGENSRETILNNFSYKKVALNMKKIYDKVLNND